MTVLVQDTAGVATSYRDATTETDNTYVYAVTALSMDGDSPRSTTMSITRAAAGTSTAVPVQLYGRHAENELLWLTLSVIVQPGIHSGDIQLVSVGVTKLNETVALMNQFSEGDYEKIAKANTKLAPIATVVVPNVRDDGLLALIGVLLWEL